MNKYFKKWLKLNNHRFNHTIEIFKSKNNCLYLKYDTIIPQIRSVLYNQNISLNIEYNDYPWDMLITIDIYPEKTFFGEYYCRDCLGKNRTYHKTLEELYCEHSFELFLEWSNENIKKENYLLLAGLKDHFTYAKIITPEELKKKEISQYTVAIFLLEEFTFSEEQ